MQSNFDTRASDFGSFLVIYLITTVIKLLRRAMKKNIKIVAHQTSRQATIN